MLGVLALSHVPAAASWTGTSADTVSGSKIVVMPVAERLQATAAKLGPAVDAALPPELVLTLLAGLLAAARDERVHRSRSGPGPCPARGPPVALR